MQPPIWPQLLLQAALIALNAFFVATETAVLALNETLLRRQAEEGDAKAARLVRIVEAPAGFLCAIRIGITLAGFLAAAFAAEHFAGRLTSLVAARFAPTPSALELVHTLSIVAVTLLLCFVALVLGELAPKGVAMQRPERVARFSCGVVGVLAVVLHPLIWLLTACTNGVLRLLHIDPSLTREAVSEEEIRLMVDMGEEKGAIETGEREMIENIFEFNNMTAEDVMIHRTDMTMLWVEDTDEEIVRTIEETGLSRYPVYDEDADDVIGILNSRAYFLNARLPRPQSVRDILRDAYFVPETVRADVLFRDMQSKKIHMAIVVDEYGGTSGLVTLEDLLEEIVGKIYDEFDPQDELEIIQIGDNLWRIAGSADLEDVAEILEMEFPEDEEAETIGGLVFAQLSVIPEDGSHPEVDAAGLHIRVEQLSDRRVEWALVSKAEPAAGEAEENE